MTSSVMKPFKSLVLCSLHFLSSFLAFGVDGIFAAGYASLDCVVDVAAGVVGIDKAVIFGGSNACPVVAKIGIVVICDPFLANSQWVIPYNYHMCVYIIIY